MQRLIKHQFHTLFLVGLLIGAKIFAAPTLDAERAESAKIEEVKELETEYHYRVVKKGDPFLPPDAKEDVGETSIEIPIINSLQRYKLADLKVIGIWQMATGEKKALVMPTKTQDGLEAIVVKKDDPIGNQGGKVTAIESNYVGVREFRLEMDGTRQFRDDKIYLGEKPKDLPKANIIKPSENDKNSNFEPQPLNLSKQETSKEKEMVLPRLPASDLLNAPIPTSRTQLNQEKAQPVSRTAGQTVAPN